MTFLARSLAVAAALAVLPGTAQADPTTSATLAALQTVAVADDAGVAQALAQPATPGTTQVTVVVSTTAGTEGAAPTPAVVPPPNYTPSPYYDRIHQDRKSGHSMVVWGVSLGISAYICTSMAGALAIDNAREMNDDPLTLEDESRPRDERRAFGRALLIPGIGPALAIPQADTALRAWAAGMSGLTQAAAAAITIVGIHRLGRARRFERLERLSLGGVASAQGGHVALRGRF